MTRRIKRVLLPATTQADTLVVVLHGCTWTSGRRAEQLRDVIDAVRQAVPSADVLAPLLPIEFWSLQDADNVVTQVLAEVDAVWKKRAATGVTYQHVMLVGFSFGSVLIRQVYCIAAGAQEDASINPEAARPWARAVRRIVLLAGVNRGWTTDSPVTRIESFANSVGTAIGHLLPRKPTIFALRRGAPFLTRMRLQWVALESSDTPPPVTVQLLGTRDDIVSPDDNLDLATGSRFVYIEVPQSAHFDVVDMGQADEVQRTRRRCFTLALVGTPEELGREALSNADVQQLLPRDAIATRGATGATDAVDDVVFVVHGIRDKGYWTRKVARVVVSEGRQANRRVVAVTPTYGYFPMLPFLMPWTRRSKVEWLLDMYVNVRCAYPGVPISYIGHSNGTYVLAGALERCPAMKMHNVVFAGSVVPSRYEWSGLLEAKRVCRVLNYVATEDFVVAFFPRLLNVVGVGDLGGAGFDGFHGEPASVIDVHYVSGRHSAALDERNWQGMASFVLGGDAPPPEVCTRPRRAAMLAWAAPFVWLLLIAIVLAPTYLLLLGLGVPNVGGGVLFERWQDVAVRQPAWMWAAALFAWARLVSAVLVRL